MEGWHSCLLEGHAATEFSWWSLPMCFGFTMPKSSRQDVQKAANGEESAWVSCMVLVFGLPYGEIEPIRGSAQTDQRSVPRFRLVDLCL